MNEIQYIGEHLWVGQVGHFCIVLAFVASILSAIAYSANAKSESYANSWRTIGRVGYLTHGVAVLTIVGILFFAMYNKYYEYIYVYDHVSDDLPLKYTLSAFWEGQEGSFLLWMFWHIVLGWFIIAKGSKWESPVMAVFAMAEIFLSSMLLGIHIEIGDWVTKFGANPFLLIRDTMQIPIFNNADYLSLISGDGLNPLLQNYWMTIHPPVTFLGFASTIVPFAFAIAGLWTGKYKEWLKPAMPWALFSGAILGTGILMGSVWAYEALSFGGYWSWDPVENAVLVPWLMLIAGIHTHLIAKATGYSIRATVFFYATAFPLIVYSTFLTRSGILGDTSAHAFTEMGLEKQLIAFFVYFFAIGLGALIYHYKRIPSKKEEEGISSREFWMFIGSLILLFSAVLIGVPTSLPVYNTLIAQFDENFVGRVIQDVVPFYNKFQIWIAIFIAFLSGAAIMLRYNESRFGNRAKYYIRHMGISLAISAVLTGALTMWFSLHSWQFYLMAFSAFFVMISNLDYLINVVKCNLKLASSAISHFGFGMMIIGLLGSGLNKETISYNPFVTQNMFDNEEAVKNYVPLTKGKPLYAQGYLMDYQSDTLIDRTRHYQIQFTKMDSTMKVEEQFTLRPTSVYSQDFKTQNVFNPDTKHYWTKDIFSCLVALAPTKMDAEEAKKFEDSLVWTTKVMTLGDTLKTPDMNWLVVNSINYMPTHEEYNPADNDFGVEAVISAGNDIYNVSTTMKTALGLQGALLYKYPDGKEDLGLRVRLADNFIEEIFDTEDELTYKEIELGSFGEFEYNGFQIKLNEFNNEPKNRNYTKAEGDIALGAKMSVTKNGITTLAEPIYIIRGNSPMGVKSYLPEHGLHIRFTNIDPQNQRFKFQVAQDQRKPQLTVPLEYVEKVPRTDYLVLQAQVFPGINLLWLGSILMMVGLFVAMGVRMKDSK